MLFLIFISSGLFLGWSLGANDAANIFGTAVGTRMLSFKKAALIASIFVILGAVMQGSGTSKTLSELGKVDSLAGAFTVALCSALTVYYMTRKGLPVSTSQAIVGAIIGWSLFTNNPTNYGVLGKILTTWVSGPLLGIVFSAVLFILLRSFLRRAKIHVIKLDSYIRSSLIVVGAFGAYSLGANNIANVIGVFVSSAPDFILDFGIFVLNGEQILFLIGGVAIATGIFTYSKKVMDTVGNGILSLSPEAAIVVVLSQALVLFIFSSSSLSELFLAAGLPAIPMVPVSSTQVVVGAVLGIGFVKGVRELQFKALGTIALGWLTTPLAAGLLTYFALFFVKNLFELPVTGFRKVAQTSVDIKGNIALHGLHTVNMVLPGLLIFSGAIITILIYLYFRQQKLRYKAENELLLKKTQFYSAQKSLSDIEVSMMQKTNDILNHKLDVKRQEFINVALNISEQRSFLEKLVSKINEIKIEDDKVLKDRMLNELQGIVRQKMSFTGEMDKYEGQIEQIHKDFNLKLSSAYPFLSQAERRLAVLLRMKLSNKEISAMMSISPKSVEISRYRLKKRLNLGKDESLGQFICSL